MVIQPSEAVVVGVDGSDKDARAIDWAADEAAARGLPLHVLYSFSLLSEGLGIGPELDVEELGAEVTDEARRCVNARRPNLVVTTEILVEDPAVALVDASRRASVVVVGARGLGRFAGRLLGSVSQKVAAHAHGVVVVVRDSAASPEGPVVIGVDPGHTDPRVLQFGFAQAARRAVGVQLVHARPARTAVMSDPRLRRKFAGAAEQQTMALAEIAEDWALLHPDVAVDVQDVTRHPVEALVAHSAHASLVVVGSRARSRLAGLHLGSVAYGVLLECPVVAIVRVPPAA